MLAAPAVNSIMQQGPDAPARARRSLTARVQSVTAVAASCWQAPPLTVPGAAGPDACSYVAQVTDTALVVGAAVTLSRLQARLGELVAAGAPHETGVFAALLEQLRYFAGVQIRNVATVGGCATDPGTC